MYLFVYLSIYISNYLRLSPYVPSSHYLSPSLSLFLSLSHPFCLWVSLSVSLLLLLSFFISHCHFLYIRWREVMYNMNVLLDLRANSNRPIHKDEIRKLTFFIMAQVLTIEEITVRTFCE